MLGDIDDSGRNLDPDRAPSSHPGALCDGVDEDPESCGRVRSQSELLGISNEVEHSAKYGDPLNEGEGSTRVLFKLREGRNSVNKVWCIHPPRRADTQVYRRREG